MIIPRYFKEVEFERCTPPCKLSDMSDDLIDRLDYARALAGVPFILTSAYRSYDWEYDHGRFGTSSHCKGMAVDISCQSSEKRLKIVQSALRAGFRRIGIYSTFIHLDVDPDKPACIWLD